MSAYTDKITELRDAVEAWLDLLNDPFKAPEQKVGLPPRVATLAFETVVQYECVRRGAAA